MSLSVPVAGTRRALPPSPLSDRGGRPAAGTWALARDVVHLNHGSFGAVPAAAAVRQQQLVATMDSIPGDWFTDLPSRIAGARARIAGFIGADERSTALVPNASAGVTVVLNAVRLAPGAEILVTDHTYGAVLMAAERAAARVGGRVVVVDVPLSSTADEVVALVASAATDRTGLLIVDQITSATARLFPVGAIVSGMRRLGIPTLVDAAHAPGMLAVPLEGVGAEYWVGNLHKWACAPRGTAALVVEPGRGDDLHPLIDSWGARDPFPQRFDRQGTVDATCYLAAPVSLDTVETAFGWDAARRYMSELVGYGTSVIAEALDAASGGRSQVDVGMPAPAMRLLQLPDGLAATPESAHQLRDHIARRHHFQTAITSWGGVGYLRLSAHLYNLPAEYDAFAESVVPDLVSRSAHPAHAPT